MRSRGQRALGVAERSNGSAVPNIVFSFGAVMRALPCVRSRLRSRRSRWRRGTAWPYTLLGSGGVSLGPSSGAALAGFLAAGRMLFPTVVPPSTLDGVPANGGFLSARPGAYLVSECAASHSLPHAAAQAGHAAGGVSVRPAQGLAEAPHRCGDQVPRLGESVAARPPAGSGGGRGGDDGDGGRHCWLILRVDVNRHVMSGGFIAAASCLLDEGTAMAKYVLLADLASQGRVAVVLFDNWDVRVDLVAMQRLIVHGIVGVATAAIGSA